MKRRWLSTRRVGTVFMALLVGLGTLSSGTVVAAQSVTISGVFSAVFGDPPAGSNLPARAAYAVTQADGTRWTLNLPPGAAKAAGGPLALIGQTVQASGQAVTANELNVSTLSPGGRGGAALASPDVFALSGAQRWATLLCRFGDETGISPQPLSFFDDTMGSTKPGANDYWQEQSYGNINLNGSTQHDWQNLPSARSAYFDGAGNADLGMLAQDCASVHDAAVDFSQVDGINFMFNDNLDCCAWGGTTGTISTGEGSINFRATWMPPWAWGSAAGGHGVLGQEMGHGFGMPHEGCQGTTSPYDSQWDVQSAARQVHTNADYKDRIESWIAGTRKYTATTAQNQIIELQRLALPDTNPGSSGYLIAKIPLPAPAPASQYYTVESRKFAGYDNSPQRPPGEAVVIHFVDSTLGDKQAQVVHGSGACNGDGGKWLPGELFQDAANNISVAVLSSTETGFVIAINPDTDVTVSKTATPSPATAGELLTYNIRVDNLGPGPATGVVVKDTLPAGVTYVANTDSCAGPVALVLTCTMSGSLPVGGVWTFGITVRVNRDIGGGAPTTITNTVNVVADQDSDATATNNNYSLTTLVVTRADIKLTKECKPDQPNKQPAGLETFCEIYVDNLGPSDATNVVITDRIINSTPITITAISSTTTSGAAATCPATPIASSSGTTITCNDAVLPVGARDTIKISFVANDAGDVDDNASVTSDTPDPDTSNNAAVGKVSFVASADLSVTKTAPATAVAGTEFNYSFTVANAGPSAASNVVLRDVIPSGVSVVSVTPPAGDSCTPGVPGDPLQPLTCSLGTIASGSSDSMTLRVRVLPGTPKGRILLNQASVSSSTSDANTGNNSASVSTTVDTSADLVIVKTADAAQYKPNTTITYHVTVTNNGPSDAQSVTVVDTLPDQKQAIYKSDTGACIFQAPKTLTCSMGTLAAGASKDFYIYAFVKGAQGAVINSAKVSSATSDPNLANNSATVTVTIKGGKS